SSEEAATCKRWLPDAADILDGGDKLCEAGYRVMTKYDTYSKAYACFIQRVDGKNVNENMILTGRGSSAHKAFKQALFKHHVLFQEDWSPYAQQSGSREIDD